MKAYAIEIAPGWYRCGYSATSLTVAADLFNTFHEATDALQRLKQQSRGPTYAQARVVPVGDENG
jgi:hypothetical protein